MVAITDHQKARLHELNVSILELTRDGKRDIEQVSAVLQIIKDDSEFARRFLSEFESDLLKFIGSASVIGAREFVAKDRLKECNIGWTGDNFQRLLMDKVEKNVPPIKLNIHALKQPSLDDPIIKELGGEERVEIPLATFLNFLKGRKGGWYVAYIRDIGGDLLAVDAPWAGSDRHWYVRADPVRDPDGWRAGGQVLSRK